MDNESLQEAKDELIVAGYIVGVEGDRNYYKARVETPDEWEYEGKLRRIKLGEEDKLYAEIEKEAVIIAYRHLEQQRKFADQAQEIERLNALLEEIARNLPHEDESKSFKPSWVGIVWSAFIAYRKIADYLNSTKPKSAE